VRKLGELLEKSPPLTKCGIFMKSLPIKSEWKKEEKSNERKKSRKERKKSQSFFPSCFTSFEKGLSLCKMALGEEGEGWVREMLERE